MRIGVNALYLLPGGVGGTEIYLRELIRWLPHLSPGDEFYVVTNRECEDAGLFRESPPHVHLVPTAVTATSRPARLLFEQCRLPLLARTLRFDVLLNPGFTAPAWCPCPCVTTFHDLQHKRHPEYFRRLDLLAWNLFLSLAAHRSTRILTVSEASAADFRRFYPKLRIPIDVTPLGARDSYFTLRPPDHPAEDYLLCVSTLHPHKNHVRLVRAFSRWRARTGADTRLVLAGLRGFAADAVERSIEDCGASGFVSITGWIPAERLDALYRDASAFIFPSLFEGFGIPVVEALACGLPAAVSDVEPMRSHAADAALLFDPLDEASIEDAIGRILGDQPLRERLRNLGPSAASRFRWEETARLTVASLHAAARQANAPAS
jgi:glycosyltransferase involved in cell wall biosynthesis